VVFVRKVLKNSLLTFMSAKRASKISTHSFRFTPEDYTAMLGRARRADAKSIQVTSLPD